MPPHPAPLPRVRPAGMPPAAGGLLSQVPDSLGRFGAFGGRYVPETLSAALDQLQAAGEFTLIRGIQYGLTS